MFTYSFSHINRLITSLASMSMIIHWLTHLNMLTISLTYIDTQIYSHKYTDIFTPSQIQAQSYGHDYNFSHRGTNIYTVMLPFTQSLFLCINMLIISNMLTYTLAHQYVYAHCEAQTFLSKYNHMHSQSHALTIICSHFTHAVYSYINMLTKWI